jgi:hypothetical protein
VIRTWTAVEVPSHPASTVAGSIASLNVKVMASPASTLPAVAPPLAAAMSVAVGATVSTVKVCGALVPVLPDASDCEAVAV